MTGMIRAVMVLFISGVVALPASAADEWDETELLARFETLRANKDMLRQAYNAGKQRATLCSYCHGEDGNSLKDNVPNLAGQNPLYLWIQIHNFATGKRRNYVMQALAKNFSNEDKINLAVFYSSNKVKISPTDHQLAEAGEKLYKNRCVSCHGLNAQGTRKYARLAGQKQEYIRTTLKNFRSNSRNKAVDASVRRSNIMEAMVKDLKDLEIRQLAAYLAGLE